MTNDDEAWYQFALLVYATNLRMIDGIKLTKRDLRSLGRACSELAGDVSTTTKEHLPGNEGSTH